MDNPIKYAKALAPGERWGIMSAPWNAGWSSPVARQAHNLKVVGSNPTPATNFTNEIEVSASCRTVSAQNSAESERLKVRFPKIIRYRRIEATIYGKSPNYPFYRVAYYVAGKRVTRSFKTYQEAKVEAEHKIREIAEGSQAAALNADQSRDALAALERLETFRQSTGKRLSLLGVVSEHVELLEKLNGRSPGEAVEGYLRTVVVVQRKDIGEAVEEFIESRKHKSEAKDGKRSQMSPLYSN